MFTEMIGQLKKGELPSQGYVRVRLDAGITKKLGILKTPYLCWSSDPKINPVIKHLFWAAVLMGDREKISLIEGLAMAEQEAAGGDEQDFQAILKAWLSELSDLEPEKGRVSALVENVKKQGQEKN